MKYILPIVLVILTGCSGGGSGESASLTSISIAPPSSTITQGSIANLLATGTYSNGTTANITSSAIWTSTAPNIASVSNTGVVTGLSAGSATVTASINEVVSSGCSISVISPAAILSSITITPTSISIAKGTSTNITATGIYSDGSSGNISGSVIWSSSDSSIVTLNASGLAKGISEGASSISATLDGITSNTAELTVTAPLISTGGVTVSLAKPLDSALVDTNMPITATTKSTYSITSVTGSIAGKSIPLAFTPTAIGGRLPTPGWIATADLTGVTPGYYQLVITAVDGMGGSGNNWISVKYDPTPTLIISKPLPYGVATPSIDLDISCNDNDAGCGLSVRDASGQIVLSGSGNAIGSVNLQQYLGKTTTLAVSATDSAGQIVTQVLSIPVIDTTRQTLLASVPGRIFDFAGDNILYLDDTVTPQLLKIRSIASGADTTIYSAAGGKPIFGYLHSNGAMFIDQPGNVLTTQVYDWRNGVIANVSSSYQSGGIMVKGNYATYFSNGSDYYLRDLSTGTNQLIAAAIGNTNNSLASSGVVAYWGSNYEIYLWSNGTATQLTNTGATLWNVYPATDGINVVFAQTSPCCTNQTYKIMFWNGSSVVALADLGALRASPPQNYSIANGYVAYSKPDATGTLQVWRHHPNGVEEQLTFYSSMSLIDSLSDTGIVTIKNWDQLYAFEVGGSLINLGTAFGKRLWWNGTLYGIVGGSVFTIATK